MKLYQTDNEACSLGETDTRHSGEQHSYCVTFAIVFSPG